MSDGEIDGANVGVKLGLNVGVSDGASVGFVGLCDYVNR
jgi:hypothetical protein